MATKTNELPKKTVKKTPTENIAQLKIDLVILKRNMLNGDVQNVRAYKYKRRELARLLTKLNATKKVNKEII